MNRLDPDARALIELARAAESGTAEDRARVRRKVSAALGIGVVALAGRGALDSGVRAALDSGTDFAPNGSSALAERISGEMVGGAAAKSAGLLGISPGSLLYAATFLLGGALIGGVAFLAIGQTVTEDRPEFAVRSAQSGGAVPRVEEGAETRRSADHSLEKPAASLLGPAEPSMVKEPIQPEDLPLLEEKAQESPPPRGSLRRAAAPAAQTRSGLSLSEEARDLAVVHEALREGNHDLALSRLDAMDRRSGGALGEERLVARVLSLCGLARVGEAESIAQRVQSVAPESPLLSRLQASCAKGALSR